MSYELEFNRIRTSEDLEFLRSEKRETEITVPESMMHAVYLASKTKCIQQRIKELEQSLHEVFG